MKSIYVESRPIEFLKRTTFNPTIITITRNCKDINTRIILNIVLSYRKVTKIYAFRDPFAERPIRIDIER